MNKKLADEIENLIIKKGCTFGEAISTLKYLTVVYFDKGNNLLNNTDVQEVAKMPRFIQ